MKEVFDLGEHLLLAPNAQCPGACLGWGVLPERGGPRSISLNSGGSQGMSMWDLVGLLLLVGVCSEPQSLSRMGGERLRTVLWGAGL